MIVIKLREAMEAFRRRTGRRVTYRALAAETGLAKGTLEAMGSQLGYNATLETIEKVCRAVAATPGELLELMDDPPKQPAEPKSKRVPAMKKTRSRKSS